MMQTEGYTLQDVTSLLRRRWTLMGWVALLIVLAAAVIAFSLDTVYRGTALIVIECPEVPDPLIPGACGEVDRAQRIERLQDEVLERENIVPIIARYDLFADIRQGAPPEAAIGDFRRNVLIEPVYSQEDPRSKSLGEVVGFNLSFLYGVPETARDVARDLTELFVAAGARRRQAALGEASSVLEREADRMRDQLREAEGRLATFKQRNPGAMPDDRNFNRQQLERKQTELEGLNAQIRDLENRQALMQTQLSQTEPYIAAVNSSGEAIPGAAERVQTLQAELIRLLAIYSPDHPDVIRVRRELESLAGSTEGISMRQALEAELAAKRAQLDAARSRYDAEHPDVQTLERAVANLEERIAQTPATSSSRQPNNPVYLQMRVQVQGLNNELAALRAQRGALQSQLAQLESRVELAPEVERELLELTRDYNLAKQSYDDARSKQMAADRTGVISGEQLTENYKIQRPANLPWEPWFPNRPLFMIIGVFLGLTLGVGAGLAAEALDSTVRGTRDVRTILEMPPIAAVPFVATARDLRRQRFRRLAASLGVIVLVVGVGLYVQLQRSGAV
jgi:uncharacterized protein involved in exopolysaccharide biosynthesis